MNEGESPQHPHLASERVVHSEIIRYYGTCFQKVVVFVFFGIPIAQLVGCLKLFIDETI